MRSDRSKRRYQGPADTSPLNRIRVELAVAGAADRIVATATEEVRELALLGVPEREGVGGAVRC